MQHFWLLSLAPIWYIFAQFNWAFLSAEGQMQAIRNTKLYKQAKPFQPQHFGLEWIFRWRTVCWPLEGGSWDYIGLEQDAKPQALAFFNKLLTVIQLQRLSASHFRRSFQQQCTYRHFLSCRKWNFPNQSKFNLLHKMLEVFFFPWDSHCNLYVQRMNSISPSPPFFFMTRLDVTYWWASISKVRGALEHIKNLWSLIFTIF